MCKVKPRLACSDFHHHSLLRNYELIHAVLKITKLIFIYMSTKTPGTNEISTVLSES